MATIRVKRTTGSTTPSGLTFGELAYVAGTTSFYIGNSAGTSVRIAAEVDTSTSLGSSDNKIPTQKAVKDYVDNALAGVGTNVFTQVGIAGQPGITADTTSDVLNFAPGTGITLTSNASTDTVTIGLLDSFTLPGTLTVGTNLIVTGDMTINGTTTTVNSNVTTIDDPILLIGTSGGVPITASDGGKDRGIAYTYYAGGGATGFFGVDASTGRFTYIPVATFTSDVVDGAPGTAEFLNVSFNNLSGFTGILQSDSISDDRTWTLPDHSGTVVVPTDLGSNNYVLKAQGSTNQPIWVDQAGLTVGAASKWSSPITLSLGTDLSGSITFDGSGNVTLNATIAPNSVALGTDTSGNYVQSITTGSAGLTASPTTAGEGSAATISFTTITTGLNVGTFSFASGEFTNNSGTISIGVVDGGTFP